MSTTEQQLLALHGAPMMPLKAICQQYLGNGYYQARIRANKNALPFPAFRLDPTSNRSPWMVKLSDIAAYIDGLAKDARKSWTASQL